MGLLVLMSAHVANVSIRAFPTILELSQGLLLQVGVYGTSAPRIEQWLVALPFFDFISGGLGVAHRWRHSIESLATAHNAHDMKP
jgi:hypothetical protein